MPRVTNKTAICAQAPIAVFNYAYTRLIARVNSQIYIHIELLIDVTTYPYYDENK